MLIHASKGLYEEYYRYIRDHTDIPIPDRDKLAYGGIVGIANLVLCSKPGELPAGISREQRAQFSGVHHNYYGFLFEQATPLPFTPCAGKLGIFEIDIDKVLAAPAAAQATLF